MENKDEIQFDWIEASDNQWGIKLLDLRPVAEKMLSTSKDPRMAQNAISYGGEDGTTFIGQEPDNKDVADANIIIPIRGRLESGVLFNPSEMEHKWAIYYHQQKIIFVRSWLRKVFVIAETSQKDGHLIVEKISGKFTENETPDYTCKSLQFLLISHALRQVEPAPLPEELEGSPYQAAMWSFSNYGNMAIIGTFDKNYTPVFSRPLCSHSLLHIAVARNDIKEIEKQVANGINIHAFAGDGLTPLHWSMAADVSSLKTLLELGANPDACSTEGATPIMNAVQSDKLEHLMLLINSGADVNATDLRGFTALHRAAEMGKVEITEILLAHGADKQISAQGYTALSLAETNKDKEEYQKIINILK